MENKKISTWEAACIITGYGIGGGVLAMPYLAAQNGIIVSLIILVVAFLSSVLLHYMIADVCLKCGPGSQVISIFSRFLLKGKLKTFLTILLFGLLAVVLCANLAAYISGAAEVLAGIIPVGVFWCKLAFYVVAASVVFFGLKAVAVSEKLMVAVIFGMIAVLAVFSFIKPQHSLPVAPGTGKQALAYFGMSMLAFAAFFSVPQAVEGLSGDEKEIKKAIFLGMLNNLVIMIIVIVCALIASKEVTEVGMVGWSAGIGSWAQIVGGVFTLVAMLTTYWSVSLALGDIVKEQLKWDARLCWLIATLPSMIIALLNLGSFLDFLEIAGGAIAIIIAVLFVPCFRKAYKETGTSMLGKFAKTPAQIYVVAAYILMAIGSII